MSKLIVLLLFFVFPGYVYASSSPVKISNFNSNTAPEWVEIQNQTDQLIDLSGWTIRDGNADTSDDISLSGCLGPLSYLSFYNQGSWLNNIGDTISVFNASNVLIDQLVYTQGKVETNPKTSSTACPATPTISPTIIPSPTNTPVPPTATLTPTPIALGSIQLSEFMAAPADSQEWVEIYNNTASTLVLSGWKIDDIPDGGASPKDLGSITLSPYQYYIVDLGSGFLNNDYDSIRILNSQGQEMDRRDYTNPDNTTSWSKNNGTWCQTTPSKGVANSSCVYPSPTPTNTIAPTLAVQPSPTSTPIPTLEPTITPDNPPIPEEEVVIFINTPTPTPQSVLGLSDINITPTQTKSLIQDSVMSLPMILISSGLSILFLPLIISKFHRHG